MPTKPTIVDAQEFDPSIDAQKMKNAMKGIGTDEKQIIDILTQRSQRQRLEIAAKYNEFYKEEMVNEIRSEVHGKLAKLLGALMIPSHEYDCQIIRESLKGLGTNETALIEIICSRTPKEMESIKECYLKCTTRPLERDIKSDTSCAFQKLLLHLIKGNRQISSADPDLQKIQEDVEVLYKAGSGRSVGFNTEVLCEILVTRSVPHLRQVFDAYQMLSKQDIEELIRSKMTGDDEKAFIALIECIRYPWSFFAKEIHGSIHGLGTSDNELTFLIVSRSEIDLGYIRQEYERLYGKSLESAIKGDTTGTYKKALVSIIKGNF